MKMNKFHKDLKKKLFSNMRRNAKIRILTVEELSYLSVSNFFTTTRILKILVDKQNEKY